MPTPEQVRTAIENHFRFWNAGDRAGWIRSFAENVVFHDPVGSPPKHGRSAAEKSWDNSFSNGQKWTLVLTQLVVCGDEAAITLDNHGVVNGQAFTMRGIEIWKVDDSGRVCQVRAYFEPPATVELNPYFQRQRDTAGEGAR
jgi:ketosteroid isomerase-like protein